MNETPLALLLFFDNAPEALLLYEAFAARVREIVPAATIRVQKTQISFANRYNLAFVSRLAVRRAANRPRVWITITFGLDHRIASPRIDAVSEPYPNRWTHHVMVGSADELDDELMGWVREAAAYSAAKRPAGRS